MINMKRQILFFTTLLLLSGCARQKLEPKIDFKAEPTAQKVEKSKQKVVNQNSNGSLFNPDKELYSSNSKTLAVGDIIVIYIEEIIKSDSEGERKTDKRVDTDLGGGIVAPAVSEGFTPYTGVQRLTDKINSAASLGYKSRSENTFTGKTTTKHDEEFTAIISSVIQKRYQNGNYLVYGEKEILIDGQLQAIQISGVARPYDIKLPDNSISSSKLANAKIMYKKQGTERDATVKPWAASMIENVWPF